MADDHVILHEIVGMRKRFYKLHKRPPKQLWIGEKRLPTLIEAVEDFQTIDREELLSDARLYGMSIHLHPSKPDGLGMS